MDRWTLFFTVVFTAACGGKHDSLPKPAGLVCDAPYVKSGDVCAPRFDSCGDDEVPILGGGCRKVGVPASGCGEGFVHDGHGACSAVVPAMPCARGTMAVPGDVICHVPKSCGAGKWGDIPLESDTLFVDGSGADSGDGTQSKPFRKIVDALSARNKGSRPIIAIAEGKYAEDVLIYDDARLIGVCPEKVEIRGTMPLYGAIETHGDVEVSGVSLTGDGGGISVAEGALTATHLWIHDTTREGIDVRSVSGPATATISDVLIERAIGEGIMVQGARASIERVHVRDTSASGTLGGECIRAENLKGVPAHVEVSGSNIEHCREAGLLSIASSLTVRGCYVHDHLSRLSDGLAGSGLLATNNTKTGAGSDLVVEASVFARNQRAGISAEYSTAHLSRVTSVDNRRRQKDGFGGRGIECALGTCAIEDTFVARNFQVGIAFVAAVGTLDRVIARDQLTDIDDLLGLGVGVWMKLPDHPSDVAAHWLLAAGNRTAAVSVGGSTMRLGDVALLGTRATTGSFGDGLSVTAWFDASGDGSAITPASVTVARAVIDGNERAGLLLDGSSLTVEDARISCNSIDLVGSDNLGRTAAGAHIARNFDIGGVKNTVCGCGAVDTCRAQTGSLNVVPVPP